MHCKIGGFWSTSRLTFTAINENAQHSWSVSRLVTLWLGRLLTFKSLHGQARKSVQEQQFNSQPRVTRASHSSVRRERGEKNNYPKNLLRFFFFFVSSEYEKRIIRAVSRRWNTGNLSIDWAARCRFYTNVFLLYFLFWEVLIYLSTGAFFHCSQTRIKFRVATFLTTLIFQICSLSSPLLSFQLISHLSCLTSSFFWQLSCHESNRSFYIAASGRRKPGGSSLNNHWKCRRREFFLLDSEQENEEEFKIHESKNTWNKQTVDSRYPE